VTGRVVLSLAALFGGAVILCGCSSDPAPSSLSTTPAIPTDMGTASERAALLTTAELTEIPGLPPGISVNAPSSQGALFEDPDPTSPCGTPVAHLDLADAANNEIVSSSLNGFQSVIDLPVREAMAFITAWKAGTRPGCPPYTSVTNTGVSETSDLVTSLVPPHAVDQAACAWLRITEMDQTINTYWLVLRAGGRLEFDLLASPTAQSTGVVDAFAQAAELKLKSSLTTL